MSGSNHIGPCGLCGSAEFSLVFSYSTPPVGETAFDFSTTVSYKREMWRCKVCGHFLNHHQMNLEELYHRKYIDATYGVEGLLPVFQQIMALPPERSDNYHRVKRIVSYMSELLDGREDRHIRKPSVLDVGSGLCVFLQRMKEEAWECTALDPDSRAVEHARHHVGVDAICGDFMTVRDLGSYDLITFNKVLEHVADPVGMLKKGRERLREGGVVYVEVPDGEVAMTEGPGREEFFIEHRCVFSMTSLSLLATRAGLVTDIIERLREPSGKYSLRAFLIRNFNRTRAT